jgi:flagellar protein FliS
MKRGKINSYRKAQLNTADPAQRIVMVYDGIVRYLDAALNLCEEGKPLDPENIETVHNNLQLAQQLVMELQNALNTQEGGEIAIQLDRIYQFWCDHLTRANMDKQPEKVREVREMAAELRESWQNAVSSARKSQIL